MADDKLATTDNKKIIQKAAEVGTSIARTSKDGWIEQYGGRVIDVVLAAMFSGTVGLIMAPIQGWWAIWGHSICWGLMAGVLLFSVNRWINRWIEKSRRSELLLPATEGERRAAAPSVIMTVLEKALHFDAKTDSYTLNLEVRFQPTVKKAHLSRCKLQWSERVRGESDPEYIQTIAAVKEPGSRHLTVAEALPVSFPISKGQCKGAFKLIAVIGGEPVEQEEWNPMPEPDIGQIADSVREKLSVVPASAMIDDSTRSRPRLPPGQAIHPLPSEIAKTIESLPPLQRERASRQYIGLKVDWMCSYSSARYIHGWSRKNPEPRRMISVSLWYLRVNPDDGLSVEVTCSLEMGAYKGIEALQANTPVRIKGEILEADQYRIELEDAELEF